MQPGDRPREVVDIVAGRVGKTCRGARRAGKSGALVKTIVLSTSASACGPPPTASPSKSRCLRRSGSATRNSRKRTGKPCFKGSAPSVIWNPCEARPEASYSPPPVASAMRPSTVRAWCLPQTIEASRHPRLLAEMDHRGEGRHTDARVCAVGRGPLTETQIVELAEWLVKSRTPAK